MTQLKGYQEGIHSQNIGIKYSIMIWATTWKNQQVSVRPAKTQISLGIHLVWSVFAVCSMGS